MSKRIKSIGNTMCSSPIYRNIACQYDISQHNLSPVTAHCFNSQRWIEVSHHSSSAASQTGALYVCVHSCFSVSLCQYYLPESSKKPAPWLFFIPFSTSLIPDTWAPWEIWLPRTLWCAHPPSPIPFFSICFHCWLKLSAASRLLHSSLEMEA